MSARPIPGGIEVSCICIESIWPVDWCLEVIVESTEGNSLKVEQTKVLGTRSLGYGWKRGDRPDLGVRY
jgi:hypothetical protein